MGTHRISTGGPAGEIVSSFSFDEASAVEQDAIILTIPGRAKISAIWIDMVNVTQDTTIQVYHKIDGTNYRSFETDAWTPALSDGVMITELAAYRDVKVSLQCSGLGADVVNVPYTVI